MATPKYIIEYQPEDENGNPIGNLTHLVADTPEEMFEKQKAAHINATRALVRQTKAFEELRARKRTPLPPEPPKPVFTPEQQSQRKALGVDDLEAKIKVAEAATARAVGAEKANIFMRSHLSDFFPCEANSSAMQQYLKDNNLEFTVDNLEIAFAEIGSTLAKDPKWSAGTANSNRQDNNEQQTVVPQPQRQTSFGIQPGATSGHRPTGKPGDNRLSKKDVIALMRTNPTEFKKRMRDPQQKAELDAALARV